MSRISVQAYTLRKRMQTPEDADAVLRALADMGLEWIQPAVPAGGLYNGVSVDVIYYCVKLFLLLSGQKNQDFFSMERGEMFRVLHIVSMLLWGYPNSLAVRRCFFAVRRSPICPRHRA